MAEHGTATKYSYGCRCDECTLAARLAMRRWRAAMPDTTAYDKALVKRASDRRNKEARERNDAAARRKTRIRTIYGNI